MKQLSLWLIDRWQEYQDGLADARVPPRLHTLFVINLFITALAGVTLLLGGIILTAIGGDRGFGVLIILGVIICGIALLMFRTPWWTKVRYTEPFTAPTPVPEPPHEAVGGDGLDPDMGG